MSSVGSAEKAFASFQQRLQENGRTVSKLKHEAEQIGAICLEEDLSWLRHSFLSILQGEIDWETEIEGALEKCGVNLRLSERGAFSGCGSGNKSTSTINHLLKAETIRVL